MTILLISISNLGNFKNPLVLACLNLTLDAEDLLCWYIRKRWFLRAMRAAQAA